MTRAWSKRPREAPATRSRSAVAAGLFQFSVGWAVATGGREDATFAIAVDGTSIGVCGLRNLNRTSRTSEHGSAIGDPAHWGHGCGREAICLLLDDAFRYRNFRRVWLGVRTGAGRAICACGAAGFVPEGRQREHVWSNGRDDDVGLIGVPRGEWRSL